MGKLSTKDIANTITGGYVHIILPDNSTSTGFISKRIKLEDFVGGGVGSVDWGDIGGTLSDQTDLQAVLDTIIQSDWNQADTEELDYIKNKPTIPNLSTVTYHIEVALAQLDKNIALKTGCAVFPCPENLTLQSVFVRFGTAPTGSSAIYDINVAGSTILSTKITIETGENSSLDATNQPVISSANIDRGAAITVDCDQIGATVAGQNPVLVMTYVKR